MVARDLTPPSPPLRLGCSPPARGPQVLCKPKLMPLKSITLEKLQQMERRAAEAGGEGDPDAGGPPLALS